MNAPLIDRLLRLYSHLPAHPGKGKIFDRLVPQLKLEENRYRLRYGVKFDCDLSDKVEREIY